MTSFLRGRALRVTRLDACGRPVYGEGNQVVTDGFITVGLSAEVQEGDAITVTKANGQTCINEPGEDQLQWYTTEIEFCDVDPDLVNIMNQGWDKVLDAQGNVIGFNANGTLSSDGYALELWLDTYGTSDACSGETAQGNWGYLLLPWVKGGAPGDIEVGNDAISFTFNGKTKVGSRWRRGPYPVQQQANGAPGPLLQPIGNNTHYRLFETTIRPPEPEAGAQPVDRPTPEVAELVITGVPGETPRRTVRLRADNHGFGPVLINWGDGTPETTAADGQYVTHTYTSDGSKTIQVRDQQTPAVTVSKTLTVPLPADDPQLVATADDPTDRYTVTASVTLPAQASGEASVDWGDGTDPELVTVGGGGEVDVTHTYKAAGVYTVTVRRSDVETYRARVAVAVPVQDDPEVTATEQSSDATGKTVHLVWDNSPNGPVSINWGDGTVVDQTETGTADHAYTANGSKTVTVTSKANAAASTSATFTIPFP
ncbi:hypothetical protein [Streptomyces longwoodensis]|uniref:hypothetical protein n=1 Tax=Streptomyces longwoodensis TaxID=68231 RepID=UPI0036FA9881